MMVDPEKFDSVYLPYLKEGFAKAGGGKSLANFNVVAMVSVIISDDLEKARMPVKGRPRALHRRHGRARQELLQRPRRSGSATRGRGRRSRISSSTGRRWKAGAAVPDELVDAGAPGRAEGAASASGSRRVKEAGKNRWV
jgi:hypothetical protein